MRKLLKYMKGYEKQCVLGPLFKLLEATFELLIPLVVARIVDVGIGSGNSGYLFKMCALMILLGLVGLVCAVAAQYFAASAAVGFATRLRHSLMEHILSFSYERLDTVGSSALITRMTSDINQVQNGVNLTLRLLLRSPFVVFGAMIMAFTIDFSAALIFAGVIPVLCLIVFGIMLVTMPMYRKVQARLDEVTSATRQNLSGVRVLRAFRKEKAEKEAFGQSVEALAHRQIFAGRISGLMNPVTFLVINLAIIALIRVGAVRVDGGDLSQGLVIALYNYMGQILVELIKMANLIINMTKAAACAGRISGILDMPGEEAPKSGFAGNLKGEVRFENVSLRYNVGSDPAISDVSFSAQPGQTIGIIGGTGAGKTSIVNLIPCLYRATEGRVLVDGVDVKDWDPEALRGQIGIVPQRAVLFRGTIRENLAWGKPDASDKELWKALRIAQAEDVVRSKEGGLDALVEQGGSNFSGGQKQRLTIARALVRDPGILILDDSASALDYATDAGLRKAIASQKNPPTTFLVSQRAASVRNADRILVLDDGRVVGQGTHGELLASCEIYQEIYYSQFPKEVSGHGKAN